MRTSAPFSPLRTLLLLLPFFAGPAVVILGTPQNSTVEAYGPSAVNPDAIANPRAPSADSVSRDGPVASLPSHRGLSAADLPARPAPKPSQMPQDANPQRRWAPAHSSGSTAAAAIRANSADSLEDPTTTRNPTPGFDTASNAPVGVEATARTARPDAPSVKLAVLPPAGEPGSPFLNEPAVGGDDFPLGTSVALSDSPARRAVGEQSFDPRSRRGVGLPHEDVADAPRSRSPEVLRAQEPDTAPQELVAGDVEAAGITWREAQRRLERVGAARYCLETWGDQGQFRFSCSVPLKSNAQFNRRFEAQSHEPMRAVEHVLDEIERWQQAESFRGD